MNDFIENLKREASEQPIVALGVGAAFIGALAKLVEAAGSVKSKNAYAKIAKNAAKNAKKR